jgi:hypothetical protein
MLVFYFPHFHLPKFRQAKDNFLPILFSIRINAFHKDFLSQLQ